MKRTIWKFEAIVTDRFSLIMPKGSEILCIQIDLETNKPCIWAEVDPNQENEQRIFELYGTGYDINYDMGFERKYIGTYQLNNGQLVFHLFERIN